MDTVTQRDGDDPSGAPLVPPLLPHHAEELITGSGISPQVIAQRGYRSVTAEDARALGFAPFQCRPGLLVPQWTLAGVQLGHLIKPDEPRTDHRGKRLKYEAPTGSVPHFDVHPEALPLLANPAIPVTFTEGTKKGDAAWSRGMLCISITGVWQFVHDRLVVPDLDEIPLQGRRARVIFDSDVTRKPEVAEALLRFCEALKRRGARVEVVYLPEGPGGSKLGIDDWFAAGGTVDKLDALARPWDGQGPGIRLQGVSPEEADRRYLIAEADRRALVRAIKHASSLMELQAMVSTGTLVLNRVSRGEVDADGNVVLSAMEIARDHRPKPEPGERLAPTNPDGTRPYLARSRVTPLLSEVVNAGGLEARPIPVDRKHATSGATWRDTAWVVPPVASLAALLNPWIETRCAAPKPRKPRTMSPPCPHCGEVHPIKRVDYCLGCGVQVGAPTIINPVLAEPVPEEPGGRGDNLSPVAAPPPPTPSPSRETSYLRSAPLIEEPSWVADAPPPEGGDDLSPVPDPTPAERQRAPWEDVQEQLVAASHASTPQDEKQARQALGDRLAAIARERGRPSFPKATPHPDVSAQGLSYHFETGD